MVIRPAVGEDAPALVRVYVESSNEGYNDGSHREVTEARIANWAQEIERGDVFVAVVGDAIAGLVCVRPARLTDAAEIDSIHVAPAYWRQGIGRSLMDVALDVMRSKGYSEAVLWTLDEYPRGHAFYIATGWTIDATVRVALPHRLGAARQYVGFRRAL